MAMPWNAGTGKNMLPGEACVLKWNGDTRFQLCLKAAPLPQVNAFKELKRRAEWRQNTRPWFRPPYGAARQKSRGSFQLDIA
jgi:hypothetical protein